MDEQRKLPVFETVGKAISYSLKHIVLMIKVSWLWTVIMIAATAVLVGSLVALDPGEGASSLPMAAWPAIALVTIIYILAIYAIAVAWHRALLLGEHHGWFHLSVGSRELAYLGYALVIIVLSGSGVLVGTVAAYFSTLLGFSPGSAVGAAAVLGLIGILAMFVILARLHLVLPGAAVGDRRMSLGQAFALTAGNTWRITGGFLLIALLNGVVNALSSGLEAAAGTASVGAIILLAVVVLLASIVLAFVTLSYMSFCYWFFVPPPDEGDLA